MPMASCTVDPAAVPRVEDLPAETQREIAAARAAVADLATTEAAAAAGYRLFLGTAPTMGQHWVNRSVSRAGTFDPEKPSILMFAPVDGEDHLVGVSYTLRQRAGDPLPKGFTGDADVWHTHDLPRGDGHIAMVHLWFEPALEGPFTDHNPYLPYLMAGLPLPPAEGFAEAEQAERLRGLALALGEAYAPFPVIERVEERDADLRAALEPHREAIRALVPALEAAYERGDAPAYAAFADEAIGRWLELRETFLASVPERVGQAYLTFSNRTTGCGDHHGHAGDHDHHNGH
jgi:hypothetical protein